MQLIQRIKKRLFRPRVLSGLVTSGSRAPRSRDAFVEQGQSQVYRIVSEGDVQELFQKINALWDNAWGNLFQPEHRILIKINLNTSDPYPASTSPEMLAELCWGCVWICFLSVSEAISTARVSNRLILLF